MPIPHQRGLALVGDAYSGNLAGAPFEPRHHLAERGERALPEVLGVMLHPAIGRKMLRELPLRQRQHPPFRIEGEAARTGGALVDGYQDRHLLAPPLRLSCAAPPGHSILLQPHTEHTTSGATLSA